MVQVVAQEPAAGLAEELELVRGQEREQVREVVAEELVPEREQVPVGVLVQELAEVEVRQLLHGLPQICHLEASRVQDNPKYLGCM